MTVSVHDTFLCMLSSSLAESSLFDDFPVLCGTFFLDLESWLEPKTQHLNLEMEQLHKTVSVSAQPILDPLQRG